MYGDIDKPRLDQHAFDLLRKLLSLGLSRFEPQPLLAIEQAEGREKTKPVRYVTDKPTAAASRPSQTPAK
jgi:hypothetical protein